MARLGDLLARVRVASDTGTLSRNLGTEILAELTRRASPAERRTLRDDLLRQAASQIQGTPWNRAKALEAQIVALEGVRHPLPDGRGTVRDFVIQALAVDPDMPRGWRQLLRLIDS